MSAPDSPKVWSLWQQERIKPDQAIGYIIQNDLERDQRIAEVEQENKQLREAILRLRADVDSLIAHTKMPPNPKAR